MDEFTESTERWLPVVGWEGLYSVSDMGRVRSESRDVVDRLGRTHRIAGRVLTPDTDVYPKVVLWNGPINCRCRVHVLVLTAFKGPRPPGMLGCHDDGDNSHNSVSNLYWGTPRQNALDAIRHGSNWQSNKIRCKRGHILALPNLCSSSGRVVKGHRACLACHRADAYVRSWAKKGKVHDFKAISDAYYAQIMASAAA